MHEYVTAREAAELLGISYSTVMSRIRKGKIEAIRRGWSYFIHRSNIGGRVAPNKDMAKTAR